MRVTSDATSYRYSYEIQYKPIYINDEDTESSLGSLVRLELADMPTSLDPSEHFRSKV